MSTRPKSKPCSTGIRPLRRPPSSACRTPIVPKAGRAIDEAELIAFARASLAAFKAPKSIDFVDALPRNASGKVLKKNLREPYWQGFDRRVN